MINDQTIDVGILPKCYNPKAKCKYKNKIIYKNKHI